MIGPDARQDVVHFGANVAASAQIDVRVPLEEVDHVLAVLPNAVLHMLGPGRLVGRGAVRATYLQPALLLVLVQLLAVHVVLVRRPLAVEQECGPDRLAGRFLERALADKRAEGRKAGAGARHHHGHFVV